MTTAKVIKIDPVRDLALLEPVRLPSRPIKPIKIAAQDTIKIGDDVHAIGHPLGEAWTYTGGYVSAIRPNYEWSGGSNVKHSATVIQTQTPINPGNSGGPLLSNDGALIGINAFHTKDAQGLNFAVSAKDVREFLAGPLKGELVLRNDNKPCIREVRRNQKNNGLAQFGSLKCDEWNDVVIEVFDDENEPVIAYLDTRHQRRVDGYVLGDRKTGKWKSSVWDVDSDGTFRMEGVHANGELVPTTFKPRCIPPSKPLPKLECSS